MYHHHDTTKKQIIGKKFLGAKLLSENRAEILYDGGSFIVSVHGDCCSQSVFYDVVVPIECIGEEILDCAEGEWEEPHLPQETVYKMGFKDDGSFECASIWDISFRTKSGKALIRHANDSNGYYDGMTSYDFQ